MEVVWDETLKGEEERGIVCAAFGMGGEAPGGSDPAEDERDGITGAEKWC